MFTHRFHYLIASLVVILLGLCSRRVPVFPAEVGDALWAVTLYLCLRFLFWKMAEQATALVALSLSFAVEFSQLLTWDWLVAGRQTLVGHLLLGQGFLAQDLLAYTLGIFTALLLDKKRRKTHDNC